MKSERISPFWVGGYHPFSAHQGTFHVVFKFGDKLYAIHEQALEKVLADVPFISDQLAIYEFYEGFVFQWFPVIHISRGLS